MPKVTPTRRTRSSTRQAEASPSDDRVLPSKLDCKITGLSKADLAILNSKQRWLQNHPMSPKDVFMKTVEPVNATLVFAQEHAGTAVCISSDGLLLTCSHCVAETEEELAALKEQRAASFLLFANGRVVKAKCVAWDGRRDLALLRVVATQRSTPETDPFFSFPSIAIATRPPALRTRLVCIGHPGSEDLEASTRGIKTNYDTLFVSDGRFLGYASQDLQDNSEIGALKHDCWTYWGHSGAPLVDQATGELVGLHSSWDDKTAMRRGIALEAIREFLKEHTDQLDGS